MAKNKHHRGAASQFYVAGEICRREAVAVVTLGNCPNTDILASNKDGTKFAHVQVKTYLPGRSKTCHVGMKAEIDFGPSFFWVLAGIPEATASHDFEFFVIPSRQMARAIKTGFETWRDTPGAQGQVRDAENTIRTAPVPPHRDLNGWSIERYRNRWDLILRRLGIDSE